MLCIATIGSSGVFPFFIRHKLSFHFLTTGSSGVFPFFIHHKLSFRFSEGSRRRPTGISLAAKVSALFRPNFSTTQPARLILAIWCIRIKHPLPIMSLVFILLIFFPRGRACFSPAFPLLLRLFPASSCLSRPFTQLHNKQSTWTSRKYLPIFGTSRRAFIGLMQLQVFAASAMSLFSGFPQAPTCRGCKKVIAGPKVTSLNNPKGNAGRKFYACRNLSCADLDRTYAFVDDRGSSLGFG